MITDANIFLKILARHFW